jgi:hypothetical protein
MSGGATVPPAYLGLWRRREIRHADGSRDASTRVLWFQGERYHIDLRIPADRPALADAGQLGRMNAAQAAGFGAQIAFAGTTLVDGARCAWHPEIAFPAVSEALDAGWMRFDAPDRLHEAGLDGSYDEDWERLEGGPVAGMRFDEGDGAVGYLLVGASWAAWARGRRDDAYPGRWSEFCFARREHDAWRIVASNHPWLEGQRTTNSPWTRL